MQCPTPISILDKSEKNPRKLPSKRITVPCGRCGICKKNRRAQWTFRLIEELKDSFNCHFVTLTYAEENLSYNFKTGEISLQKKDLQDFIKRLREIEYRRTGSRVLRYYAIGEYGSKTQRPHFHAILYNCSKHSVNHLRNIWKNGHTHCGTVTAASIHYVTKYHVNRNSYQDNPDDREPEFAIMSQGLGKGYIERNKKYHRDTGHTFVYMDGYRINMPRYYREKIFDPELLKLYSQRNVENAENALHAEANRLHKLGYEQPYREIWLRSIEKGKKIKSKSQEKDIL